MVFLLEEHCALLDSGITQTHTFTQHDTSEEETVQPPTKFIA